MERIKKEDFLKLFQEYLDGKIPIPELEKKFHFLFMRVGLKTYECRAWEILNSVDWVLDQYIPEKDLREPGEPDEDKVIEEVRSAMEALKGKDVDWPLGPYPLRRDSI